MIVDTLSPMPLVSLFVKASTEGTSTAVQAFDIEICGSENVNLSMPLTNSSMNLEYLQFEGTKGF